MTSSRSTPTPSAALWRWTAFSVVVLLAFFLFRLLTFHSTPQPQQSPPDIPPPEILDPLSDTSTPPAGALDYIADAEDTLPTLAAVFSIDVETLAAANHLSPTSPLSPGRRLLIPIPPSLD